MPQLLYIKGVRKMKKAIAIIISVIMIITVPSICLLAASGGQTTFRVESVSAEAGSTVDVDVVIDNNPGVLGAVLHLEYDSALTLTGAECGDAFSPLVMTAPGRFQSPCQFTWDGVEISDSEIKDGTVLTLTFSVPENAADGTQYAVNISGKNGDIIDKNLSVVNAGYTSGNITVGEGVTPQDPVDPPAPTDEPTIAAQSVTAAAGSTVDMNIDIFNNPGLIGATLRITYDSNLTLVNATKGDAFSVLEMTKPGRFQSPCQFTWDGVDIADNEIKDGTILTLTFEIPSDAQDGTVYDVSVSADNGAFIDKNLNTSQLDLIGGTITVGTISEHNYVIALEQAPDCITDGFIIYECEHCGDSYMEELPALGHNYALVFEQAPDCTNDGLYIYECTRCSDSYLEEPTALGHQIVIDEAVEATCQASGLTEGQHCSRCGEIIVAQQTIPKTDHNYEFYRETVTCEKDGYVIYRCSMCKAFNNVKTSAYGHSYAVTSFSGNTICATCQRSGCGKTSQFDFFDLVGARESDSDYVAAADVNNDGIINGRDLAVLKTQY